MTGISRAPRVSVVIPVYRGERWISRTLDSLATQSFRDFEVLCVDDHSPDNSAEIVQALAERDPRFRLLRTPRNLGIVPKVINYARKEIQGDFFVYSSQDDFFSRDWLETMVARIEQTDGDAAVPNLEFIDDEGRSLGKLDSWREFGEQVISGTEAFILSLDWTIAGNALWRADLVRDHGYYDFGLYADEYTARAFFLDCRRVCFCSGTFFYHQGNAGAITKIISPGRLDYAYNQFRVWELLHQNVESGLHGPRFARTVVRALFEALVLIESDPRLSSERHRLRLAIQGMRSRAFVSDLQRAFGPAERLYALAAVALVRSELVRTLSSKAAVLARASKKRLHRPAGPSAV